MKTLTVILIITSLVQSTLIPLDLVLLILISRALIRPDKTNLFLAFGFGLFNSILNLTTLGFESLFYLLVVEILMSLAKTRVAANALLIIPLSLGPLFLHQLFISILTHSTLQFFPKIFFEALLALPIFYLTKIWEERFIVRKEFKLKAYD